MEEHAPDTSSPQGKSFWDVVSTRRTVRKYKALPVPMEFIHKIVRTGSFAPSAMNSQPWEFIVINEPATKKQIKNLYSAARDRLGIYKQDTEFIEHITLIIICARKERSSYRIAGALAMENMLLASADLGLGSIILGAALHFEEDKRVIARIINLPESCEIISVIGIGYGDERPKSPQKRNFKDMIHYESF